MATTGSSETEAAIRLPDPCLVVLVGPSGSGKSHWADANFPAGRVLSSDRMRALVGEHEHDQRAGTDAFAVLDLVLERRLKRRLFTVVDTLGLEAKRRQGYVALARRHRVPVVAITFDTPAGECRARNARRSRPVPPKVLAAQLKSWPDVVAALTDEGFDRIHHGPAPVRVVDPSMLNAPAAARRQQENPVPLDFGLHVANFTWPGGPAELGRRLATVAQAAEEAGFTHLSVMDHFLQIPVVGRRWDEMLDGYTALGYVAACTSKLKLLTLVTGITYRNVAHLGKIIATLDVLSGGRAMAGLGAAWNEDEHQAYGWPFPPVKERFALLEDALRVLPMMWGPGAPPFRGKAIDVPETICYPRPVQERVPILVGGGGEKKTLRLVAKYADACNLFGDVENVRHKLDVLREHCEDVGRDPAAIGVTQLSSVVVTDGPPPEHLAARTTAGTVEDHIGRYRELAEAGVQTAFVRMPDLGDPGAIARFAPVIEAFRPA